jgi:filamentous hemagglutinin
MFCGTTWTKGAIYGEKALNYGLKAIKTALQSTKPLNSANKIVDASKAASTATKLFHETYSVGASVVREATVLSTGAENVNAALSLKSKLSGLQKAQNISANNRVLVDGRIRYYNLEVFATNHGPTRGASYVTEWNPNTGKTRAWIESYDHFGDINRVHPKSINGQTLNSLHYPPTKSELGFKY